MTVQTTIYHAAALFSGREAAFNTAVTEELERTSSFRVLLPQRDGYEFGALQPALARRLPDRSEDEIALAVQSVIFVLDMGRFVADCDVVIANLDEPLDEGVVVEISYARMIGKPVIGFRTDARSPFGRLDDRLGGLHFFPAYQCDVLIRHAIPAKSQQTAEREIGLLVEALATAIHDLRAKATRRPADNLEPGSPLGAVQRCAGFLFTGIEDIHSDAGLAEVTERYLRHADQLAELMPAVRQVTSRSQAKPAQTSSIA